MGIRWPRAPLIGKDGNKDTAPVLLDPEGVGTVMITSGRRVRPLLHPQRRVTPQHALHRNFAGALVTEPWPLHPHLEKPVKSPMIRETELRAVTRVFLSRWTIRQTRGQSRTVDEAGRCRRTRAGIPPTTEKSATLSTTTAPAATTDPRPIVTPARTVAPRPTQTSSINLVLATLMPSPPPTS